MWVGDCGFYIRAYIVSGLNGLICVCIWHSQSVLNTCCSHSFFLVYNIHIHEWKAMKIKWTTLHVTVSHTVLQMKSRVPLSSSKVMSACPPCRSTVGLWLMVNTPLISWLSSSLSSLSWALNLTSVSGIWAQIWTGRGIQHNIFMIMFYNMSKYFYIIKTLCCIITKQYTEMDAVTDGV